MDKLGAYRFVGAGVASGGVESRLAEREGTAGRFWVQVLPSAPGARGEAIASIAATCQDPAPPRIETVEGRPVVVQPGVEARPLAEALRAGGLPSFPRRFAFVVRLFSAIEAAHGRGQTLGGPCPSWVVVSTGEGPDAFLLWGPAVAPQPRADRLAAEDVRCLAPESCAGAPPSIASDVYAAGVLAAFLLGGRAVLDDEESDPWRRVERSFKTRLSLPSPEPPLLTDHLPQLKAQVDRVRAEMADVVRLATARRAADRPRIGDLRARLEALAPQIGFVADAFAIGNQLHVGGASDRAVEVLRAAQERGELSAQGYGLLGEIHAARPDASDDAIRAFRRAIALEPANPRFHAGLGEVCLRQGFFPKAIEAFEEVVSLCPTDLGTSIRLARVLLAAGRVEKAALWMEMLKRRFPDRGEVHLELAALFSTAGDRARATDEARKAVLKGVPGPAAHMLLGELLRGAGDLPGAVACFERAVSAAPGSTEAWNALGYAYVATRDNVRAIEAFRRSLSINARQAGILDVLSKLPGGAG